MQREYPCIVGFMLICVGSVSSYFVLSEESMAIPGVGVDKLVEIGKLEYLKKGPVFWVDSADSNPRIGKRFG